MTPLVIVELALKIVLLAMEGQPPDVREKMWRWHVEDIAKLRKFLGIDT